jgi:hypothetical protein
MKKRKKRFCSYAVDFASAVAALGSTAALLEVLRNQTTTGSLDTATRPSERAKEKKKSKKKKIFFFLWRFHSHADLFRLGAVRRTLAQSHADVLDHCATTSVNCHPCHANWSYFFFDANIDDNALC